jgi:hypothetical protein
VISLLDSRTAIRMNLRIIGRGSPAYVKGGGGLLVIAYWEERIFAEPESCGSCSRALVGLVNFFHRLSFEDIA